MSIRKAEASTHSEAAHSLYYPPMPTSVFSFMSPRMPLSCPPSNIRVSI